MESINTDEQVKVVQHVNRASSDELLRKFAELDSPADDCSHKKQQDPKRRKRSRTNHGSDNKENSSPRSSLIVTERRSLIPSGGQKSKLLRQFGIGRSHVKAREYKNKSFIGAIEKTWRKTVEGASKVFIDKHCNRHKRLINDAV